MLYKNWPEICRIENLHFRLAVSLSTDPEFLGKLAQAFPNLFQETKPEKDGPFPLSYLREVGNNYCAVDGQDRSCIDNAMDRIGFPCVLLVKDPEQYDEGTVLAMPPGWYENDFPILKDQYERGSFPFDLYSLKIDEEEETIYYLGLVDDDNNLPAVYLYPAALVDENA
jgi:hypothetical protein